MKELRLLPLGAVFALSTLIGCADEPRDDDAPLSDYASLFEGAPSNDELPFDIKADGPPPAQHFELIDLQTPVKSQGSRGVCSIFSTVALMEHLYLIAGMEDPNFSEQYLQWSTKFELGVFPNTSGSNNHFNLQAIHRFGIPEEDAWPYESAEWNEFDDPECGDDNENKPTRCYTNGAPPPEALEAEKFFLPSGRFINSRRAAIMDHIRVNGTGVVIGLDFFYQSWNHRRSTLPRNLDYWDQGIVLSPNETDVVESHKQRAGHAVLLVGWDLDKEVPIVDAEGNFVHDENGELVKEKGFWLFKNSWGTQGFGIENPHGAGYGWLSMRYVDEHGNARVTDVPDFVVPDPDGGETGEGDTFVNDEITPIPDNDPEGITSTIEVPAGPTVGRITVGVEIAHTWRGDLIVRLRKGDRVVTLHDGTGGGQHDLRTTYELDEFEGLDREGTWTLEVVDRARFDVGELESWSLTLH